MCLINDLALFQWLSAFFQPNHVQRRDKNLGGWGWGCNDASFCFNQRCHVRSKVYFAAGKVNF